MGTVEDIRKVLQDFLAPELRAVTARFDAIDQRFDALTRIMDARFEAVNNRFDAVDTKLTSFEKNSDIKFASLEKEIVRVRELLDVDRRLAKLESQQSQPTQ
jgi:hypothetical protein